MTRLSAVSACLIASLCVSWNPLFGTHAHTYTHIHTYFLSLSLLLCALAYISCLASLCSLSEALARLHMDKEVRPST